MDPQNTIDFKIPHQYQKEMAVTVQTLNSQEEIDKTCGKAANGYHTLACGKGTEGIIYIPNPCKDKSDYAHLLCHEFAHFQGWHHVNE